MHSRFLHQLGVYFAVAEETAEERRDSELRAARRAAQSTGHALAAALAAGALAGAGIGLLMLLFDGQAVTVSGIVSRGAPFGFGLGLVWLVPELLARERDRARYDDVA